jgi:hypothetical protein
LRFASPKKVKNHDFGLKKTVPTRFASPKRSKTSTPPGSHPTSISARQFYELLGFFSFNNKNEQDAKNMDKTESTPRARYFEELTCILKRDSFEPQPPDGDALPIYYGGEPLCNATENGIRYFSADVNSAEKEKARDCVADTVTCVKEYMKNMEAAPFLTVTGLDEQYKLLADFNGSVLAGRFSSRCGVQFVTWDWDYGRTGVNHGHYAGNDYEAAKQDFAIRCGFVDKHRFFYNEQLTAIYHGCAMLEDGIILSDDQYKTFKGIREQIECVLPDVAEQIAASEQQQTQSQQLNM